MERVNRLGGGGDDNDESCGSVRGRWEAERYCKEKKSKRDAGEWGVVMMMVRDDEMWLNKK